MDNENLQRRIMELEEWKKQREQQQIVFPLDNRSIEILNKYFMRILGSVLTIGGVGGNTFINYFGQQDGNKFIVSENIYASYTINTATDYLTVAPDNRFRFVNGQPVYFVTEDTFPNPLNGITTYYVINASADEKTFQVSTSVNGPAVNITDIGVGKQYIFYF